MCTVGANTVNMLWVTYGGMQTHSLPTGITAGADPDMHRLKCQNTRDKQA